MLLLEKLCEYSFGPAAGINMQLQHEQGRNRSLSLTLKVYIQIYYPDTVRKNSDLDYVFDGFFIIFLLFSFSFYIILGNNLIFGVFCPAGAFLASIVFILPAGQPS